VSSTPWLTGERPAWLAEVTSWVRDAVADAGRGELVELVSVKERPWGAVLRARTTADALYFKAPGAVGRHEVTIIADLSPRWRTLVPDVVASDRGRSWMLLADHGQPMCDVLDAPAQVDVIERLLPAYADMQRSTLDRVPGWLAAGTPDRRVTWLPEQLEHLLTGALPVGTLTLDTETRTACLDELPRMARVCEELATTPMADALDHADLHGTNVVVDGVDQRLIDWGDCCITHPFSTLFVSFELVVARLAAADQRAATLRLRDAYLEGWDGDPSAARATFGLATWVAHITRAINIGYETNGAGEDQTEITALLRAWLTKRALLSHRDEIVLPIA
jgi:hypothetical protein